jgi:hypothetical protein
VICIRIGEPRSRKYPFELDLLHDPQILYHGTWSTYSAKIEESGFVPMEVPFDKDTISRILRACEKVCLDSMLASFHQVYFASNFVGALEYATDRGGEIVRLTLKDAALFERECGTPTACAARAELLQQHIQSQQDLYLKQDAEMKQDLEGKIALVPDFYSAEDINSLKAEHESQRRGRGSLDPARQAIKNLQDQQVMASLQSVVAEAQGILSRLGDEGYPVVYAVRVEAKWFGSHWARHEELWRAGERGGELFCSEVIKPDRIVAKAEYFNGAVKT